MFKFSFFALLLLVITTPAFADKVNSADLQALELLKEKRISVDEYKNLLRDQQAQMIVTDGNYPDVVTNSNYPDVVTNGNYPDVVTNGNYPDVVTNSNYPDINAKEGDEKINSFPMPHISQ